MLRAAEYVLFELSCCFFVLPSAGVLLYTQLSIMQIGKKIHKETDVVIPCQNFLQTPSPSHYVWSSTPGANTSRLGHGLCALRRAPVGFFVLLNF